MKRSDNKILEKFADSSATINPQFRASLKKQVLSIRQQPVRRNWSRLAWAPVALALVVAVLVVVGLNKPDGHHVLGPQKVSAAELLRRADIAGKKFDYTKYDYFEIHETEQTGPGLAKLKCADSSYQHFSESTTYDMYAYRTHDNGLEAYYDISTSNGKQVNATAVYDNTPKQVIGDYLINREADLTSLLNTYEVDGQPNYLVVDHGGNVLADDRVEPSIQNGQVVYEFFTKENPDSSASRANAQMGCFDGIMTHIVLDAKSYRLLEQEQYAGSIDPAQLTQKVTYSYVDKNLSSDVALQKMTAVGFDKTKALPAYPEGHD